MTNLGTFDDKDVIRTSIAVTNAGDGLSSAMKVDPQLFHLGDKVYVVLECEVSDVKFRPLKDDDQLLDRVHTLRAGGATIVDEDLVREHLEAQAARIRKAKDEASGQQNLLDDGPGQAADDDFNTPGDAAPTAPPDPEADGLTVDGDGYAGPPEDGKVTPIKKAAAKKAPAKKAPARKRAAAKKAPSK